jgi:hypothetical protein
MIPVFIAALFAVLGANVVSTAESPAYVVPVVTAEVKDRIYSTPEPVVAGRPHTDAISRLDRATKLLLVSSSNPQGPSAKARA